MSTPLELQSDSPRVAITHHPPHEGSVAEQHIGSGLNLAFMSNLENLIEAGRPQI